MGNRLQAGAVNFAFVGRIVDRQSKNSCPECGYGDAEFRKEEEYEIELQHERSAAQEFHVAPEGKPDPARSVEPTNGNEDSDCDGNGERNYAQNYRHAS